MNYNKLAEMITNERLLEKKFICDKCKDTGIIFDGKGKSVHTCFDCLKEGRINGI